MAKKKAARSRGRKARPSLKASKRRVSRTVAGARAKARQAARRARKTARRQMSSAKAAVKKALKKTKRAAASARAATARGARSVRKGAATAVKSVKKDAAKTLKKVTAALPAAPKTKAAPRKRPNLDRPRKTVADIHGVPSSLEQGSSASAIRTGRAEFEQKLHQHTSTSPALTAGDLDADWESADSTGDEAPGGDNPTPDQDVVDEIGRALGVEYDDDEELQGGDEIAARDRHRWELDPDSKEDFDEEK
jgi:hypothetical protein